MFTPQRPCNLARLIFIVPLLFSLSFMLRAENHNNAMQTPSSFRPPQFKSTQKPHIEFAEHRLLVKFKGIPSRPPGRAMMPQTLPLKAASALNKVQGQVVKTLGVIGVHLVETPQPLGRAIEALYRSGAVEYAEPDYKVKAEVVPDDPAFDLLWGLNNTGQTGGVPDADIDAPEAWDTATLGKGVIVGVVDTGVDYSHEDLAGNMWQNPGEIAADGIDNDGNGWVDDIYGIDTVNNDSDPFDDNNHGTHVTGTIGALGNNGKGITGIAWETKIMALKFLDASGSGFNSDAIEAIGYALSMKNKLGYLRMILNNSWGGGGYSQALYDAIQTAQNEGVLFLAAAGNEGRDTDLYPHYPSGYDLDNIITVGASDQKDQPPVLFGTASWSNRGCTSVDLSAPGDNIFSTLPFNQYGFNSGTSMATPHVSGIAALIWSKYPNQNWRVVKSALLNSVEQKSALKKYSVSQGRVNLNRAINFAGFNKPAIWNVSPASGAPTTLITIRGHNFGATPGNVYINGLLASVISWNPDRIEAEISAGTAYGTGKVKVARADSNAVHIGACFKVAYTPSLVGHTFLPRGWASGALVGGDFWIIGGGTIWGQTGLVEKVDLATGQSRIDSDWMMPTPVTNTGAAAIGSKIYVVGGLDWNTSVVYGTLQIFDTTSETWSAGAPLPQPVASPAVAAVDDKLYVFGGANSSGAILNTTYIYDPIENSWSSGAAKPTAVSHGGAASFSTGGTIDILGGFTTPFFGSETTTAERYVIPGDSWTPLPAMVHAHGGAAGSYYKNKPHALFGSYRNKSGELYNAGKWRDVIEGIQSLYLPMAATSGGYLYILDGYDQSASYSNNIWRIKE